MRIIKSMPEEQLDIYNEHNEPTGEVVGRKEARERGLWHRTAHIYFYRATEGGIELLVHLRSKEKDSNPNTWDTRFGGHIKAGRTILEGAIDEVREEIGITLGEEDLLEAYWSVSQENKHHVQNYVHQFSGGIGDLHFSDGEVQEARWMNIADIATALAEHPEQWAQGLKSMDRIAAFLRKRI